MAERVTIIDVSPRDGLQNEPGFVRTDDKFALVGRLLDAGVDEVEVTSFVPPKWVPQFADAAALVARLARVEVDAAGLAAPWPRYLASDTEALGEMLALVPNEKGMRDLLAANVDPSDKSVPGPVGTVAVFAAASETFSKRNTNAGIAETLERFGPVIALARERNLVVRGYISCAIECPFEGPIEPGAVASLAASLLELGVDEIDAGDTIGAGTPETVGAMLRPLIDLCGETDNWYHGEARLTLHLHDTFGRAAACVLEALRLGVRSFDGAVAGLGGCPYAGTPQRRAPGNIATELLVRTVREAGYETSVDERRLREAAAFARAIVARAEPLGADGGPAGAGATA